MSKKLLQLPPIFSKHKFLSLLLLFALLLTSCNKSSGSGGSNSTDNSTTGSNSGSTGNSSSSNNSGGVKIFNNAEELKEYLEKQPANGPDKPINVTVNANASTLPKIAETIGSAGKYVNLTISGNGLTTIPRGAFNSCKTLLVNVTIPNSVTKIEYWAFMNCTNLKSVTIPNIKEIADFT